MKTERRHELQTNVLANWLGQQIEAVKPHWQIIAGVLAGAVLIVVVIVVMSAPKQSVSGPWTSLFSAMQSPNAEETLVKVVTNNPGTKAGWYAKLAGTDLQLQHGIRVLYQDRTRSRELLEGALKDYQDVAQNSGDAMLSRRASWGIAKTYETLAATWPEGTSNLNEKVSVDLLAAAGAYRKLADESKETAVGREAQRKLDRLAAKDGKIRPSVIDLYVAMASFKPQQQQTGSRFDPSTLPETPDLSFPGQFSVVPEAPSSDPGTELNVPGVTPSGGEFKSSDVPQDGDASKDSDTSKDGGVSKDGDAPQEGDKKDEGAEASDSKSDAAPTPPATDAPKPSDATDSADADKSDKSEKSGPDADGEAAKKPASDESGAA